MPVKKKATSTVKKDPPGVASNNPDDMVQGGLKDDFRGEVIKARYVPWDYGGKLDHHILSVALTIQDDEEDQPFVQNYSCGELENFMPSMDGESSVDLEQEEGEAWEGIYALAVGKKPQMNNNTNWAHFMGAVRDAGLPNDAIGTSIEFMEGVYGHWNRIDQKKRSGIIVEQADGGGQKKSKDILVLTELMKREAGPRRTTTAAKPTAVAGGKTAAKAKPAAAAAAATAGEEDDLDKRLAMMVTEAVQGAEEGIAKGKLAALALRAFDGTEKAQAVRRVGQLEFLESSETWVYDPESGVLFAAG